MIINLYFTSRKRSTKKNKTQTNNITGSSDIIILESTWEYKITKYNNEYICKEENY